MTNELLATWCVVFLRASGLLALFPVFSAHGIPTRVRISLGALLALLLAPLLPAVQWEGLSIWAVIGRMAMEVGVGLMFGFVTKLMFFALEFAGLLISTEVGLNVQAMFNPGGTPQSQVTSAILTYLGSVIWLSLDLHHWLLVAFKESYVVLPVGTAQVQETMVREVLSWVGVLFVAGLQMAAPVMAVSFILSLVFSMLGRVVSQMNIFTESASIRLMVGLGFFGAGMQLLGQQIVNFLHRIPDDLIRIARLLHASA